MTKVGPKRSGYEMVVTGYFVWSYSNDVLTCIIENVYKFCLEEKIGREAMPEPVLISLVSDYDISMTGSAWDLSRYVN